MNPASLPCINVASKVLLQDNYTVMKAFVLALLLCATAVAKDKTPANLEWKTGVLVDQSSEQRCVSHGGSYKGTGSVNTSCSTITFYKVGAGELIYTLECDTRPLDVTVNGPIKFAISGQKFYLQDEQGKAHEVSFVQKA